MVQCLSLLIQTCETHSIKGGPKKRHVSNFDMQFFREPIVLGGCPFQDLEYSLVLKVLKSLLGPTVHEKIAYQNLKHDGFFGTTLYAHASVQVFLVPDTMGKIIRYFCSFVHLTIYISYMILHWAKNNYHN